MTRRPILVRQPAQKRASAPPELWLSEDPAFIHVIDNNGGFLLANLPMREAMRLLRAWWRHHRDRCRAELEADRRRRHMREGDQS